MSIISCIFARLFRKEKRRSVPTGVSFSACQPCFCLCLGFSQITITRPLRLMILHFSQIGFTDGRTFIVVPSSFRISSCCAR